MTGKKTHWVILMHLALEVMGVGYLDHCKAVLLSADLPHPARPPGLPQTLVPTGTTLVVFGAYPLTRIHIYVKSTLLAQFSYRCFFRTAVQTEKTGFGCHLELGQE